MTNAVTLEQCIADPDLRIVLVGSARAAAVWRQENNVPFRRTVGAHSSHSLRGFTLAGNVIVYLHDSGQLSAALAHTIAIASLAGPPLAKFWVN